ncbi:MAG TPA: cob(I)yrinic acid a,c-diamide adenosyltransferase [Bacteroidales bacterium]|nr:cob(I)yrinic acid a,c-diamide adenosyltransferase [Bacteroidales bacterium]HPS17472.1 cob(I)yrinic acid a,c-diamide adenosyltransferase [Bacteroidales bacterium]
MPTKKNKAKIYTKTGDFGETSLLGGMRIPKFHKRIVAYGTLDELNSYIGYLRDVISDTDTKKILLQIQNKLFTAESLLAAENEKAAEKLPKIKTEDITLLEQEIDTISETLPELNSFIIPGGHSIVSLCHITRCVCRRAERVTLELAAHNEVDKLIIQYLNRLSDFLFILARKIARDNNIEEIIWKP